METLQLIMDLYTQFFNFLVELQGDLLGGVYSPIIDVLEHIIKNF